MAAGKLNLGLIGAGRIGRLHARQLSRRLEQASLLVVCDTDMEAASQCARECRIPRAVSDCREVFHHPAVEAVVICSSTDTHAPLIEAAAAARKHIFCEKPLDLDLERMDRALADVEKAGVLLQVGFNRRFDANFQRVRRAVASGEIGKPELIHLVSRDPGPPPLDYIRRSGGIFLDMTIHDFDMARFLAGSEVEELYASGSVQVDPAIGAAGDLDTVLVQLKFKNGMLGTIDNSRRAVYGYDQRVEVFGSEGCIQTGNNFPNAAAVFGKSSVYRDRPLPFFLERYAESYLEELRQFLEAALAGGPSPLPGEECRRAVLLGLAAKKSAQENRPVRIEEFERGTTGKKE